MSPDNLKVANLHRHPAFSISHHDHRLPNREVYQQSRYPEVPHLIVNSLAMDEATPQRWQRN